MQTTIKLMVRPYFNPRTREGCDIGIINLIDVCIGISIHAPAKGATVSIKLLLPLYSTISIHAPAKGATQMDQQKKSKYQYFNPRTREGCDKSGLKSVDLHKQFQSTHPRRVRQDLIHNYHLIGPYFNPRTREGCDKEPAYSICTATAISIHAPAKGATVFFSHYLLLKNAANHF